MRILELYSSLLLCMEGIWNKLDGRKRSGQLGGLALQDFEWS